MKRALVLGGGGPVGGSWELGVLAGLTAEETADVLGVSVGTIEREWRFIRTWLQVELAEGEQAKLYATLKLNGFDQAPPHLAVFLDAGSELGHGLGAKTMPETLAYSVVGAIQTFWLAARARGIGVGWVSILDADAVRAPLELPDDGSLIGYLCVGYPEEEHDDPELHRHGWQERVDVSEFIVER